MNYWPVFKDETFSFGELQVVALVDRYFGTEKMMEQLYVYDDGLIRGFMQVQGTELRKFEEDTTEYLRLLIRREQQDCSVK